MLVRHTETIVRVTDLWTEGDSKLDRRPDYGPSLLFYQSLKRQQDVEDKKYAENGDKVKKRQNRSLNLSLVKRQAVDGQEVMIKL